MKNIYLILATLILVLLSACSIGGKRQETNYYVLDYQPSTERAELRMNVSNGKVLHVLNTNVNRTYNRNQLVVKESFYQVQFLNNELWANRLTDAVPNIISRRLRSYNIFSNVTRTIGDTDPHYYLETSILNIEKIRDSNPRAFLRIEFVLRDSTSDRVILTHRNDRYQELHDDSYVYLVQSFNNMIMEETNTFAAMCIMHFSGRPAGRQRPEFLESISAPEKFFFEQLSINESYQEFGELVLRTKQRTSNSITYRVEGLDSLNTKISEDIGEFNEPMLLVPGRYRIVTGHNADVVEIVDVHPRMRTVLNRSWSELKVRIMDTSQNRVRQLYRLWMQSDNDSDYGYKDVGLDVSIGDDEYGIDHKTWILPAGKYMITLGGSGWSDLRDFATITLNEGDSQTLTVIVNTNVDAEYLMIGAGVLSDDFGFDSNRFHKGLVKINMKLLSNNEVDEKNPTYILNLDSSFDNTIDHDFRPFHFNMRSSYELDAKLSKDDDLRFDEDSYSLKNTLLLYPWSRERKVLSKLALYGRADMSTHFMDEYTHFSDNKNYIVLDIDGNEIEREVNRSKVRSKIAFFPLRLKEGVGVTYRFPLSPTAALTLRGGYGWQQDYNQKAYSSLSSTVIDGNSYEVYQEIPDKHSKGIESIMIISAGNILKFISINSSMEVFFPFDNTEATTRFENENTISFRVYRNISLDVELDLVYDKSVKDWLQYKSTSKLSLNLIY